MTIKIRTGYTISYDVENGEYEIDEYKFEVKVPYDDSVCTVTLENVNLSRFPTYIMGEEQPEIYRTG